MNKIKTTISIDEELWRNFSITVIQKEGNRKLSDVIEQLIKQYVKNDSLKNP